MNNLSRHGHARALFEEPSSKWDMLNCVSVAWHYLTTAKDEALIFLLNAYISTLRSVCQHASSRQRAIQVGFDQDAQLQPSKVRILCISDTHNALLDIDTDSVDLLIHCGDLTEAGTERELSQTLNWLDGLDIPHKVFIGGNHDFSLEKTSTQEIQQKYPSLTYLDSSYATLVINGCEMTLYGTPRTPQYGGFTAFSYRAGECAFASANQPCDIFISHGPAFGYVDMIGKKHAGCPQLLELLQTLRPHLFVCGHIHVAGGSVQTVVLDELEAFRLRKAWVSALVSVYRRLKQDWRICSAQDNLTVLGNAAIADSSKAPRGLKFLFE